MANWISGLKQLFLGRRGQRQTIRRQPARKPRRHALALERLEDRVTPNSTLTISGGVATFVAAAGKDNNLTVSVSGNTYTFNDTGDKISVNGGAAANTVTAAGVTRSLSINLGDGNDVANIDSINVATTVTGGSGTNTINVSSNGPTNTGVLSGIAAGLTVTASNGGLDTLAVSNFGATTGDSNVVVGSNTITGFAPNTITYNTASGGTFSLVHLFGSNSSTLAEKFTINNPGAIFQLDAEAGNDTANVQALSHAAALNMGAGNDAINVSSDAPAHLGNVDGIQAALTIDGGTGSNTLEVSDYGKTTGSVNATLTATAVTGLAPSAINYKAVAGSFSSIQVDGSNTLGDAFTINSTLTGSPTTVLGNGGNDSFTLGSPTVAVTIGGGAGSDTLSGASNGVLASSDGTGFTGTATNVSFSGIDVLRGAGTLTGENAASTWTAAAAVSGNSTYADPSHSLTFSGFATMNGGSAADAFNLATGASGYTLKGGAGADALTGASNAVLTSSAANGFNGSAANSISFTGIDALSGSGSLTGENSTSTWSLSTTQTYSDGAHTLTISGFGTLQGGSAADTFNLLTTTFEALKGGAGNDTFNIGDANPLHGTIDGQGGNDTLNYHGSGAVVGYSNGVAVTLTGSDATGYRGAGTAIFPNSGDGFFGIDNVIAGTGGGATNDTLTGENVASNWSLGASQTYDDNNTNGAGGSAVKLTFSIFKTLQGGTAADTFNVNTATAENLKGGDGADVFNVSATLTGGVDGQAGADTLSVAGSTTLTGSSNTATETGFAGTNAHVSAGFSGIDVLSGSGALTGENVASTWHVAAAVSGDSTYADGLQVSSNTLTFRGFSTLNGGSQSDGFSLASGATGYTINGGAGSLTAGIADALYGVSDAALSSSDATGFSGTANSAGISFTGMDVLTSTGAGSLTGEGGAHGLWTLYSTHNSSNYTDGPNNLSILGFSTLNAGAGDTFNLQSGASGAANYTINGGAGADALTGASNAVLSTSTAKGFSGSADNSISFTGINTLSGSGTLTGENTTSSWMVDTSDTYNDGSAVTLTFSGYGTLQGGSGADSFNVNVSASENLKGGAGADAFYIHAGNMLTGSVDGQAGSDFLNVGGNVTLTGSSNTATETGFAGTNAHVSAGFSGIDVLSGSGGDTLTGENAASTWTLASAGYTYNDGGAVTLTFLSYPTLQGGSGADTFNVNATNTETLLGGPGNDAFNIADGVTTASVQGQDGSDTLNLSAYTTAVVVGVGGSGGTGFYGTTTGVTGGFAGIDVATGASHAGDSLTGEDNASIWTVNAIASNSTYNDGFHNLTYSRFAILDGGSAFDTFNLSAGASGYTINGGAGLQFADGITDTLTGVSDAVLSGDDGTGFTGTAANAIAFTGIDELDGSGSLTGENTDSHWSVNSVASGSSYDDGADYQLTFSGFTTLNGGSGADAFQLGAASGYTINGGAGLQVAGVTDTLIGASNAVLTSSNGYGFDGSADNSITFTGIDVLFGSGSLTGENTDSTWTVNNPSISSYNDGFHNLNYSYFTTLNGGSGADTFSLGAGASGYVINGGGGSDTLTGVTNTVLSSSDATGFTGTAANSIRFTGIDALSGSGTLTGENVAGAWTLGSPSSTYTDASAHTLSFSGFTALNGSGTDTLAGVTNATLSGSSASGFRGNADGPLAAPGSPGDPLGIYGPPYIPRYSGDPGRFKSEMVLEAGKSMADVTAIYVLDLHPYDGPGGAQVVAAPVGSPYAYLVRNTNDGAGDDVTLGVVEGTAFTGMDTLNGSGTLTGENAGGLWTVDANPTYWDGAHTLNFSGFDTLSAGNTGNTFNVTVVSSPLTLNGNTTAGPDIFNVGSNNSLGGIQSDLTINGARNDVLNVSDAANTTSEAWTITGSTDGTTDTTDIQSGSSGNIVYNVAYGNDSLISVSVGDPTDGFRNSIDVESLASSNVYLYLATHGNSDLEFAQVVQSLSALNGANIRLSGTSSDTLTLNDQANVVNTLYGVSDAIVSSDTAGLSSGISGLGQVIVVGGSGGNAFNVTPSPTTSFTVDGGSSGTSTLNYQASQVSGPADNPQDDMGFSISDGDGYYQTVYNYDFASVNIDLPAQDGNVVFNLPAGAQAVLEAAPGKPGYDDIRSTGGPGFPTTTFSNPSGSLTIKTAGSSSVVQLAAMDAGFAPTTETFDGQASDTFQVVSAGALTSATSVTDNSTLDLNGNSITVGGLVGSGIVTNGAASGTATLTLGGGGFNVFAGSIQDGASAKTALTVVGGTTFVVTGDNTYTGATLINGGLAVGNGGTTGSLASGTAITDNNVLEFARTDAITVANSITGSSGGVVAFFSGTVTLTTAETYSDPTQIFAGATLEAGVANALPSGTALTLNGTFDLNGYDATIGDLTGSGIVTNNAAAPSSSTLTVDGSNSFSGSVQDGGPDQNVVIV